MKTINTTLFAYFISPIKKLESLVEDLTKILDDYPEFTDVMLTGEYLNFGYTFKVDLENKDSFREFKARAQEQFELPKKLTRCPWDRILFNIDNSYRDGNKIKVFAYFYFD